MGAYNSLLKGLFRVMLFFSVLVMASPFVGAQNTIGVLIDDEAKAKKELREEVLDHVKLLRAAIIERDSVILYKLLADGVIYGHSNGLKQNRDDVIRSIMSGQHDYKSITVLKEEIILFGETAVVDLETDVIMLLEGRSLEMKLNIMMVWVKNKIGWKLIARQSVKRI